MKKSGVLAIIMLVVLIVVPVMGYTCVCYPADKRFNKTFQGHADMVISQSTFEAKRAQMQILWAETNKTFYGEDFNSFYNTWWAPDQTYSNSLQAQVDYFNASIARINTYIQNYAKLLSANSSDNTMIDWYHTSIMNLNDELNREDGMLWVVDDAYYLNYYPIAYWLPLIIIILAIFTVVTMGIWLLGERF